MTPPPLLLSNSLGTSLEMWEDHLPVYGDRFRVLRYGLRGQDGAPAPPGPYSIEDLGRDALELLDRLGVERASFCGVSMGGMIGMWLAINAPERLDRMVLCCTSAHMPPAEMWTERAATVREEGTAVLLDSSIERWFTPEASPQVIERSKRWLLATDPEAYAGCCEAIAAHDLRGELGAIRAPTLVIAAADDPSAPPDEHGRPIAESIPGARLVVLPGRHLVAVERPEEVAATALEHLLADGTPGMRTRREVLGDEHVDRAIERTSELTADFQDLITRYAWGEIWTRPGLDRRTRSAITITALIAHGHFEELALHLKAALRNGLTKDEIKEILLQSAIYCGVPAANRAFKVAQEIWSPDERPFDPPLGG